MDEQTEITKAQYESLIKKIDIMQDTMDRRFEEWSNDRKDIIKIDERLKIVEVKVEGTREDIAENQVKTLNKIDEHLQPMPDIVADAVSEAVKKRKDYLNDRWFGY